MLVVSLIQRRLDQVIDEFSFALKNNNIECLVAIDQRMCKLMSQVAENRFTDQVYYSEQVKTVLDLYQVILNAYETGYMQGWQ